MKIFFKMLNKIFFTIHFYPINNKNPVSVIKNSENSDFQKLNAMLKWHYLALLFLTRGVNEEQMEKNRMLRFKTGLQG